MGIKGKIKYHAHFGKLALERRMNRNRPPRPVSSFSLIYDTYDYNKKDGSVRQRRIILDSARWRNCTLGDLLDFYKCSGFRPKSHLVHGTHLSYGTVVALDVPPSVGPQIVKSTPLLRDTIIDDVFLSHKSVSVFVNNAVLDLPVD